MTGIRTWDPEEPHSPLLSGNDMNNDSTKHDIDGGSHEDRGKYNDAKLNGVKIQVGWVTGGLDSIGISEDFHYSTMVRT